MNVLLLVEIVLKLDKQQFSSMFESPTSKIKSHCSQFHILKVNSS